MQRLAWLGYLFRQGWDPPTRWPKSLASVNRQILRSDEVILALGTLATVPHAPMPSCHSHTPGRRFLCGQRGAEQGIWGPRRRDHLIYCLYPQARCVSSDYLHTYSIPPSSSLPCGNMTRGRSAP